MKASDDYQAKLRLWAANQTVVALAPGPRLPNFRAQEFKTHAEMNRWKQTLLLRVARQQAAHG